MATTTRRRRAAPAAQVAGQQPQLPTQGRQPDAAANALARTGKRPAAAGEAPATIPAVATAEREALALAPAPASTSAAPAGIVEVDVRRGAPAVAVATLVSVAAPPAPARRRLRLGGLLRQADHLVHGEPVSLAEATAEAETVTLQARLGGRVLSKTIQL